VDTAFMQKIVLKSSPKAEEFKRCTAKCSLEWETVNGEIKTLSKRANVNNPDDLWLAVQIVSGKGSCVQMKTKTRGKNCIWIKFRCEW